MQEMLLGGLLLDEENFDEEVFNELHEKITRKKNAASDDSAVCKSHDGGRTSRDSADDYEQMTFDDFEL